MKKLLLLLLCSLAGFLVKAQFSVVTDSLVAPAGVQIDAAGNAWVTETGTGREDGRVLVVKPNGDKLPVIVNLPSFFDTTVQELSGVWRTIALPNNQLAVVVGGGPSPKYGRLLFFDLTGFTPGVSTPKTYADTTKSIEISSFSLAQPGVVGSNPFSAAQDVAGNWYVVDAAANLIVKTTPTGQQSVFAKFPKIHNLSPIGPPMIDPVPTRILAKPGGGFYVGSLSGFPFTRGAATVYFVSADGAVSPYAKGLTMITDLALDSKTGNLYANQFANFGFAPVPGFIFGSGKVSRIRPGGIVIDSVAGNYGPGAGMALDAQGNLYVTSLFTNQLLKMNGVSTAVNNPCNNSATAGSFSNAVKGACLSGTNSLSARLTATFTQAPVVPNRYKVVYVLSTGNGVDANIVSWATTPDFSVDRAGRYTIYSLVYDSTTFLPSNIPSFSTINRLEAAFRTEGNSCGVLSPRGTQFDVRDCGCGAYASPLTYSTRSGGGFICSTGGSSTLAARALGRNVIPNGYVVRYVLTSGNDLTIRAISETPIFVITGTGTYHIHTLVYNPNTLNLNTLIELGTTRATEINALLRQGGGNICGALDVAGLSFRVQQCNYFAGGSNAAGLILYPNPATNEVNVQLPASLEQSRILRFEMIDLTGRVLQQWETEYNEQIKLNISNTPAGMYYIRLTGEQGSVQQTPLIIK